jgi:hypothetical protein
MTVEVVAEEEDKRKKCANMQTSKFVNKKIKYKNVQCTTIGTLAYFQIGKLKKDVITEKITTQENAER